MTVAMLGNQLSQVLCLLSLAITTFCHAYSPDISQSPPIRTKIQASWDASPLAVQILETAALESPSSFFPLLSTFVTSDDAGNPYKSPLEAGISAKETYVRSLALLETSDSFRKASQPGALDSFKFSLGLKETSPLIETHYQLYRQAMNSSQYVMSQGSLQQWYGDCGEDSFNGPITADTCRNSQPVSSLQVFDFDHVLEPSSGRVETTLLAYVDILSPDFPDLYKKLTRQQGRGKLRIILRWKPSEGQSTSEKLNLAGYGVGLDLKRVDYITIDDRDLAQDAFSAKEQRLHKKEQQAAEGIYRATGDIFEEADAVAAELVQLKPDQLLEIGLRATQLVVSSSSPLTALRKLAQDFPRYAHKLVTSWEPATDEDVRQELLRIQSNYIEEGRNYLWLNGMQLKGTDMQPYTLLRIMRKERKRIADLVKLGLSAKQSLELLTHPAISAAVGSDPPARGVLSIADMGDIFDASDRRELHGAAADTSEGAKPYNPVIVYWSDIEKDARYRHWPADLHNLLQPTYPGQMPQVRRNLINVVLALDFEKTISHFILAEHITPLISRGLGVRFGTVPILDKNSQGSLAGLVAKASWYILEHAGRVAAMEFHRALASISSVTVTELDISKAYKDTLASYQDKKDRQQHTTHGQALSTFSELKDWSGLDDQLALAQRYSRRLGLSTPKAAQSAGFFFVNGKLFPLNEEFRSNLHQTMQTQMQHLMQQIYFRNLLDTHDVSTYFYNQPTTFASRNPVIVPEEGNGLQFVNLAELHEMQDFTCDGDDQGRQVNASFWLIVDVDQPETANFLDQARAVLDDVSARICVIPVTRKTSTTSKDFWTLPVFRWLDGRSTRMHEYASNTMQQLLERGHRFAAHVGMGGVSPVIIINGRVVHGFEAEDFGSDDFKALLAFEQKNRIGPVSEALEEVLQVQPNSDLLAAATSIIAQTFFGEEQTNHLARRSSIRSRVYADIPANLTSVALGDEATAVLQFACIVDPLSESSQSWSAVLETLNRIGSVSIRLYLNPLTRRTEMPLKRFYRYSVPAEASFSDSGNQASDEVVFHAIPQSTLLTLTLDTQHAWQAFPKESVHDLDNIRLSDLKPSARERGVEATFELSNIIVEGHARESRTGQPPRGLQLVLTYGAYSTNTLVMANLGYHQLKANPGIWRYSIREGRSSEVFALDEVDGSGVAGLTEDGQSQKILLTTFEGVTIFPKFARNPGMEEVDLLDDGLERPQADIKHKATEALFDLKNRVQSFFGNVEGSAQDTGLVVRKADINIFTVASGLLYERMAMIMILSVLRYTESTVKFWFIENFLSPSFKAFIPHLAEKYGFQYELVTYTWPAWLRSQKEKQRTIWGYKILFLDVLFPLELDRVIFVDSDQIVRTDLKQLVDLDLKGAPYAYAPMGDDREDMDNFRFWKGGYWAEHLRGRPYHISALYVIDLDRFRQIAAGDRLRGQYQALSADPNSLANLDQDLPNNMQAQLPIYTLDRSWLWCETWCSDESLKDAKTIDLCNNPKTHEPKLARAKRLIPEWTVYDKEIADLASQVAAANKLKAKDSGFDGNSAQRSVSDSAEAFTDEAGQLEQAREQQKEFVTEGLGGEKPETESERVETVQRPGGHIQGEL